MTYELKFKVTGNLSEIQQSLKEFGSGITQAKKQSADLGNGLSSGMARLREDVNAIRGNLRDLSQQLLESQKNTRAAQSAERVALGESARQLAEVRQRQRDITAEVTRRAAIEKDAAAANLSAARALAAENARIAAKRADSIAAFSGATPEQLRTPQDRSAAIGREQTLRRDAELRMLEINRRADALEAKLAGTRGTLARATGNSTRETVRATTAQRDLNRQLALAGPQVTDIAVSLASGQSPFLVAIQQGGQLRDVFGGIRPALAGVGAALLSLINPITVTVAAVGGIALAFLKGQEEGLRFNRVIALTGSAAGATADQLQEMASRISQVDGATRASASDTLATVAESGKFTAQQFELVARSAEQMRQSAGRDIGATIAEFEKIADNPVDAVEQLNRKYNFLTGSILEQIRTLQEQGREQEAATLAMQAFANAVDNRTPDIVQNLGYIQRGVKAIKDLLREAGDGFLNLGRQQTGRQQFDDLFRERQELLGDARAGNGFARARIQAIEQEMRQLQDAEVAAQKKATQAAAQQRAVTLQADLQTEARQYEDRGAKRARIRISAINRANEAVSAAEAAGDAEAAKSAKASRDLILAGLAKEEAEEAKRKGDAADRLARAGAKRSQEAARQAANLVKIEAGLVQDATQRALQELNRLYDEGAISVADFYAQRQKLELEAIDASIRAAEAQRDAAVDTDDRKQAEAEILKLQRDRAEVATRAAREQAVAERELRNELQLLQARLAESTGQLGEVQRVQLEQERDELLRKFQSNPEAQTLVKQLFDVELAKSRAEAIKGERDKLLGELRDQTDYLNSQSELGGLSPVDAEKQLQEVRQQTLEQLEALRAAAQEAYNQKPTPETLAALKQLDTDILQIKASQNELGNAAKQGAVNALSGFFTDLATGAKSFKEAFKDMVRNFIQGLARMVAEALAKQAVFAILNSLTGGASGAVSTVAVGTRHSGGMAGHGERRSIPASMASFMFANAPRFHDGGPVLKAGEVPAILQTGERVLSRRESADYSRGGGAAKGTRVVNVFDKNFVPDQMDSADGERVLLNIIGQNPGRVRQILGL